MNTTPVSATTVSATTASTPTASGPGVADAAPTSTALPNAAPTSAAPVTAKSRSTRLLLCAGIVAGPLFVGAAAVQALTRNGFDLSHQPLSMLSLGDLGWVQITNFVLAGLLSLAFAVGVARSLRSGPGSKWAPRLFAVFGTGLIIGGVFVPDPALGYPIGTPDGYPETLSVHGALHAVAPPLSFLALVAVCWVVAVGSLSTVGAPPLSAVASSPLPACCCRSPLGQAPASGCSRPSPSASPGSPAMPVPDHQVRGLSCYREGAGSGTGESSRSGRPAAADDT